MCYFRCINKGNGPIKLFIGGIHGNEGETSLKFLKSLNRDDFSNGKTFIYNFDRSKYISTLKEEYYNSPIGSEIIDIIKKHKPDFYTELHCYNIKHYENLISPNRRKSQGVPPLIELKNHVLISSVSPLIRMKYFSKNTICKTLEIPCFAENVFKESIDYEKSISTYMEVLKLIAKSKNREDFEKEMTIKYPKQVNLAISYAKEIFGENFPPF